MYDIYCQEYIKWKMNKITKSKNDKTSGVMKQLRILNVAFVTSSRIFKWQETEGVLSHLLIINEWHFK